MRERIIKILAGIAAIVFVYAVVIFLTLIPEMIEKMMAEKGTQSNTQVSTDTNSSDKTNSNTQGSYGFSNEESANVSGVTVGGASQSVTKEYEEILKSLNELDFINNEVTSNSVTEVNNVESFNYEIESDNIIVQYTIKVEIGKKFKSAESEEFNEIINALGIKPFDPDRKIDKLKNMNGKVELSLNDGWNVEIHKITNVEWISINDTSVGDKDVDIEDETKYDRIQFYFIKKIVNS